MMMPGMSHAFAFAVLLIAVSFFVVRAVLRDETRGGLKVFGWVVAALLWIATVGVLCGTCCSRSPMPCMMPGAWGGDRMNQRMDGARGPGRWNSPGGGSDRGGRMNRPPDLSGGQEASPDQDGPAKK